MIMCITELQMYKKKYLFAGSFLLLLLIAGILYKIQLNQTIAGSMISSKQMEEMGRELEVIDFISPTNNKVITA